MDRKDDHMLQREIQYLFWFCFVVVFLILSRKLLVIVYNKKCQLVLWNSQYLICCIIRKAIFIENENFWLGIVSFETCQVEVHSAYIHQICFCLLLAKPFQSTVSMSTLLNWFTDNFIYSCLKIPLVRFTCKTSNSALLI